MSDSPSRRNTIIGLLILLLLILFLLIRCKRPAPPQPDPITPVASAAPAGESTIPNPPGAVGPKPGEILTPATVKTPREVVAGASFTVNWSGPDNENDFVTIVLPEAAESAYANYRETKEGPTLELTAPTQAGDYEVRYVTGRSKKVLGRSPVTVTPADAMLNAPAEVVLGAAVSVTWTGPDNKDDYITFVTKDTPDGRYGNFTYTKQGSPLTVTAPVEAGDAEFRYMTGQGNKVLARRAVRVITPPIVIKAPSECIAGSTISVEWKGPDNAGDYLTIVARDTRDGLYGNYTYTKGGSPLKILVPIAAGPSELRYMTGQGAKVLGRIPLQVMAAEISLSCPSKATTAAPVSIRWTGPNNPGDYITIVPKGTPDNRYLDYANTSQGSVLSIKAPKETGEAEVRYVSGQGAKVLARQSIGITD